MEDRKIRVLVTKIGLDGHDRGAKAVTALLREGGMEVVYLGAYQTAESIVQSAIQEDVDVVGLSCLCGEHLRHAPELARQLKEAELQDVLFIVGGVVPWEDIPFLKENGIDAVFPAGSLMEPIVDYLKEHARRRV
ncbi:MAG: cobalamin-dependent protein [Dehalococcoidia bacterium]